MLIEPVSILLLILSRSAKKSFNMVMDRVEFWRRMNGKNSVSNGEMKASLTADPRKRKPRMRTNFDLVGLYRDEFNGILPDAEDPEDPEGYLELARLLFSEYVLDDGNWLDKVHSNLYNIPEIYAEDYFFIEETPLERQPSQEPSSVRTDVMLDPEPNEAVPASPSRPESPVAHQLEDDDLIEETPFELQSLAATLSIADDVEAIEDEVAMISSRPISPLVPQGARPALNMQLFMNSKQRMGPRRHTELPLRRIALVNAREVREALLMF